MALVEMGVTVDQSWQSDTAIETGGRHRPGGGRAGRLYRGDAAIRNREIDARQPIAISRHIIALEQAERNAQVGQAESGCVGQAGETGRHVVSPLLPLKLRFGDTGPMEQPQAAPASPPPPMTSQPEKPCIRACSCRPDRA